MPADGDNAPPAPEIIQLAAYLARAAAPAKRPTRPHGPPKPIHLPDGRSIAPGDLVELWDGAFTDPERTHLITRGRGDDAGYRVDPRGFPLALAYSSPEHVEAGGAGEGARVTLAWSNRRETFGEHTVSLRDVNSGDYLDRFGSPPITTRKEQARFADILKAQLPALPLRLTPALSGWSMSPAGKPRFVLEDRASWYALDDAGAPQLDAPGRAAPAAPTLDDAAFLVNSWSEWAPDGRGVAALAFTIRGLFASLQRVGSSLVLTGATASSKTTPARFCLGVLGAIPSGQRLTLTFDASAAAMKATRAWRNDLPSVHDDFHKLAGAGAGHRVWDTLDALFRAVADGHELAARATRNGGLRDPVYLKGADIFTGELIEGFLSSAERRIAWIGYDEDRNSDEIYAAWDTLQAIWEKIGHAVIRWALPIYAQPGETGEKLRHWIERLDQAWEASMFAALSQAMPAAPQKFVRSIARSWAVMLSGARIADLALGAAERDGPFVETLRPALAKLAVRQLERLAARAGSALVDLDFFRIGALAHDDTVLDAESGKPFQSDNSADIEEFAGLGYQWDETFGGAFKMKGRKVLGWRHRTNGEDYLIPSRFFVLCQERARHLGLDFPFTEQTLAAHLKRIGFTSRSDEGRNTLKVNIPGRRDQVRVLCVPIEAADADIIEAERAIEAPVIAYPAGYSALMAEFRPQAAMASAAALKADCDIIPPDQPVKPPKATQAAKTVFLTGVRARARGRIAAKTGGAVIVLDREGAALAYGSTIGNEPHHAASSPNRVKGAKGAKKGEALAGLLDWAKAKGAEQIVITRSWALAAGLPDELPQEGVEHPWADLRGRWDLAQGGLLRWSMWAKPRQGGRTIEIILACYDRTSLGEGNAAETAASLALYRDATAAKGRGGFPYRRGPGATFINMWQSMARDAGAIDITQDLAPAAFPPPAHANPEPVADFGWMRAPTDLERQAASCIVIDGNSQYLRAMAGLACGLGAPIHHERPTFDQSRAGYWRLTWRAPAWPATLPPPGASLAEGQEGWLTTETVAFLAEIGATLQISEAWLWERSGRALDRLRERLTAALYRLKADKEAGVTGAADALKLLKDTYKQGVGRWTIRENRTLEHQEDTHRPHWRHAIMARSSALLLRDLATKTGGLHPVAIQTDAFAFLTDATPSANHFEGLKLGPQLGAYSLERTFPAADMIAALDTDKKAVFKLLSGKDAT